MREKERGKERERERERERKTERNGEGGETMLQRSKTRLKSK